MLSEIYPRFHTRYSSLRVLGPHLDGFVCWLRSKGFRRQPICARLRAAKRLDRLLWRRGIRKPADLTSAKFRAFAPRDSQQDIDLAAVVRSLTKYFEERHAFAPAHPTLGQELIAHYRRQGAPLKAIGDLLGHRSAESTCVYLRLHVEDLRDVAIELPTDAQSKVRP